MLIAAHSPTWLWLPPCIIVHFYRSMPTGAAMDHVAKKIGVELYEVPTGKPYEESHSFPSEAPTSCFGILSHSFRLEVLWEPHGG